MTDRANNNSTSYVHPEESNLLNLHKVMEYNGDGKPILRVSVGGESITITGDVTIPGSVEVNNDEGNPLPTRSHLIGADDVEYSDSNPLMTKLDATTLAALETVTVEQGTSPWTTRLDTFSLSALETVELGASTLSALENTTVAQGTNPWMVQLNTTTLNALETTELGATTLAALESVDLNPATLAALENVTVDAVTANVTVQGEVTLGASTLAALETTELGASTLAALETININTVAGNVQVQGEVTLGATTLAALETTSLSATTLAALESVDLNPATLAALENVTVDAVTSNVTIDGTVGLDGATLGALENTTSYQGTTPWIVDGEVALDTATLAALETTELGATTLAALENVTVDSVTANVTVQGEVELGSTSLAALENITIDTGDLTIDGEVALDAATLAALETTELGATTLAALENVTVDEVVATVNTDPSTHLFDLAAGSISGQTSVTQSGRNDTISVEIETVWDGAGLYPYLTSSSQVYVTSTADQDEQDSPIGQGAQTVEITGLDSSYNEVIDVADTASSTQFLRVHSVRVKTVGSLGQADGEISVRSGAIDSGTLLAQIQTIGEGFGSSLGKSFMAVYTVPAGKTAYLQTLNAGSSRGSDTSFYVVSKTFGEDVFIAQDIAISSGSGLGKEYKTPLRFTEKTDIEVRAISNNADSIGNECQAGFNLVLVDNA